MQASQGSRAWAKKALRPTLEDLAMKLLTQAGNSMGEAGNSAAASNPWRHGWKGEALQCLQPEHVPKKARHQKTNYYTTARAIARCRAPRWRLGVHRTETYMHAPVLLSASLGGLVG